MNAIIAQNPDMIYSSVLYRGRGGIERVWRKKETEGEIKRR